MDVAKFIKLAETHAGNDSSSRWSVIRANTTADKLRRMMLKALKDPDEFRQLLELLTHPQAGSWVAFCALEKGRLTGADKERCLEVIRDMAKSKNVDSVGAQIWLSNHGYSR
jgi:hypothetical protein